MEKTSLSEKLRLAARSQSEDGEFREGITGLEVLERIKAGEKMPTIKDLIIKGKNGELREFRGQDVWTSTLMLSGKMGNKQEGGLIVKNSGLKENQIKLVNLYDENFALENWTDGVHLHLKDPLEGIVFEKVPNGWYSFLHETKIETPINAWLGTYMVELKKCLLEIPGAPSNYLDNNALFLFSDDKINATLVSFDNSHISYGESITQQLGLLAYE